MLDQMRDAGARAAKLAYLGESVVDSGIGLGRQMLFGQGPEAFVQGRGAFQAPSAVAPRGVLHPRNVLWPTMPGNRLGTWAGRLGTVGAATMLPSMMRADQGEGGLSRLLGGVGGLAGMMYGGTAGGLLGAPVGLAMGRSLGHGVGHLLGSRPHEQAL
jgi:hypothetical protein